MIDHRIEQRSPATLRPYENNTRVHPPEQVEQLAASIREWGFTIPILVDEADLIIAGHGRLEAAKLLGLDTVPVIVARGWTDAQRRAYSIADNRLTENGEWDRELLRLELGALRGLDIDLSLTGFSDDEIGDLLVVPVTGLTDEDAVPAVAAVAVSSPGEIWCLGEHRIGCGDSTDAVAVKALLDGGSPNLMVTDPPYGVAYDPAWRHRLGVNKSFKTGKVRNDDRADWSAAWSLFPGAIAYVWHGGLHAGTVAESLERLGFAIRAQIIWAKTSLVMSRGDYHWQHEPCWYAVRGRGHWTGDRKQTTLWPIASSDQDDAETSHSTQKPVECMRRPMLNNSAGGEWVYEPFSGSGTSIIAAHTIGRVCRAMEIDPLYVDVAIRRWQAFTGEQATRLADGVAFDAVERKRAA